MHDTFAIGIPVLVILFGLLLNQRGLEKLEAKVDKLETRMEMRFNSIDGRFTGVDGRLDRMQADLSMFYKTLGEHAADIETLKKKMNS